MKIPFQNVIVHHTVMGDENCSDFRGCIQVMKEIQDFHMDGNGWADIGYRERNFSTLGIYFRNCCHLKLTVILISFLVGEEGSIFEARGWNRVGAHVPGMNDR